MKKSITYLILVSLIGMLLIGCTKTTEKTEEKKLKIVTTIFPQYDWAKEILGDCTDNVDLSFLLDKGVDLHSFQPTTEDIVKISTCDLFIYVGGESDEWVEDALATAKNKDMVVINMMDVLGDSIKEEEAKEGMEIHEGEEHEPEMDEHVWLSLKNAKVICDSISEALQKLDQKNAAAYQQNTETYVEKLSSLNNNYQKTVDNGTVKTLLFGDRFPFRYLVDDYGLDYFAAFSGCSAETEASFETVVFLANKIDELKLHTVLVIETSDQSIAKTIIENTEEKNQEVRVLDSMQKVTSSDAESGVTYYGIMEDNLNILNETLNQK